MKKWTEFFNRSSIIVVLVASVMLVFAMNATVWAVEEDQPEYTHSKRIIAKSFAAENFIVAAANQHAVKVGYDILKMGGNSIDAAVAVQLMLNLVEPQSSGIGGGAFLLYWDNAKKALTTFDARETAPSTATPDYFKNSEGKVMKFWEALPGGKSVGVPGTLKLLEHVHKKYGSLPWSDLFKPTIQLAEQGFPISLRLSSSIKKNSGEKMFRLKQLYWVHPELSQEHLL